MTRYPYWPRTFADAFPESCDYACAVQRFTAPAWKRAVMWCVALAVIAALIYIGG